MQSKEEIFESLAPRRISDMAPTPHFPPHGWQPKQQTRAEQLRELANAQVNKVVDSFMKVFDEQSQKAAMVGHRKVVVNFTCETDAIKQAIGAALKRDGFSVDATYPNASSSIVNFRVTW